MLFYESDVKDLFDKAVELDKELHAQNVGDIKANLEERYQKIADKPYVIQSAEREGITVQEYLAEQVESQVWRETRYRSFVDEVKYIDEWGSRPSFVHVLQDDWPNSKHSFILNVYSFTGSRDEMSSYVSAILAESMGIPIERVPKLWHSYTFGLIFRNETEGWSKNS